MSGVDLGAGKHARTQAAAGSDGDACDRQSGLGVNFRCDDAHRAARLADAVGQDPSGLAGPLPLTLDRIGHIGRLPLARHRLCFGQVGNPCTGHGTDDDDSRL